MITQEFKPNVHLGVDIMFDRAAGDLDTKHPSRGAGKFYVPLGALVVAAADGVVTRAELVSRGNMVRIRHPRDSHDTLYMHLATLQVQVGDQVKAGQVLGEVGYDPRDAQEIVHLHFEMRDRVTNVAVDPEPFLRNAPIAPAAMGLLLVAALVAARWSGA